MRNLRILFLLLLALPMACGCGSKGRSKRIEIPEPDRYTYRIVKEYPHARNAYTQGFVFHKGILWEGTGEYGGSEIRTLNLNDGSYFTEATLPDSEFGEGITIHNNYLYQLTWTENVCHVYSIETGAKVRDFRYIGEGWGLTTDGEKLYLSDGSAKIFKINPENFRREGSVTVTYKGQPVDYINELEWIEGKIWANVYLTDQILIIDPATGRAEGVVELEGILPDSLRDETTDVLNGIAYDAATKRILITGKKWPKIYEIELIKQ
ncbi:MAG: glutaminyl-peptide cyclotransferase [Rikenellaceae bacterium]|nr:glutaminyl-peptide cyclotransferase [Rikenellaceae bacterium]